MEIIYVLIPLSILLMILAIGAFFWAVRNDQFDDLDSPADSDGDSTIDALDEELPEPGREAPLGPRRPTGPSSSPAS